MKKAIIVTLLFCLIMAASWAITVGIIKLITICFGWTFSWPVATGIWLSLLLAKSIFSRSDSK